MEMKERLKLMKILLIAIVFSSCTSVTNRPDFIKSFGDPELEIKESLGPFESDFNYWAMVDEYQSASCIHRC